MEALGNAVSEDQRAKHRAYVVGAVIQAAAALESEVWAVIAHGPGHHLGSNGIDAADRKRLLANPIDNHGEVLRRYEAVLRLLQKPPLAGERPYEMADLLVKLRNEIAHYKSKWGAEMEGESAIVFSRLQALRLESPAFTAASQNFFPHRCLSASLASWSVTTSTNYLNAFYSKLGIVSPLTGADAPHLVVPAPRHLSS